MIEILLVVAGAQQAFIFLDRPLGTLRGDQSGGIPHLELRILLVVDHGTGAEKVALPPLLRPDDRISFVLLGAVQDSCGALHALDDTVVDEELPGVADCNRCGARAAASCRPVAEPRDRRQARAGRYERRSSNVVLRFHVRFSSRGRRQQYAIDPSEATTLEVERTCTPVIEFSGLSSFARRY